MKAAHKMKAARNRAIDNASEVSAKHFFLPAIASRNANEARAKKQRLEKSFEVVGRKVGPALRTKRSADAATSQLAYVKLAVHEAKKAVKASALVGIARKVAIAKAKAVKRRMAPPTALLKQKQVYERAMKHKQNLHSMLLKSRSSFAKSAKIKVSQLVETKLKTSLRKKAKAYQLITQLCAKLHARLRVSQKVFKKAKQAKARVVFHKALRKKEKVYKKSRHLANLAWVAAGLHQLVDHAQPHSRLRRAQIRNHKLNHKRPHQRHRTHHHHHPHHHH